MFFSLSFLFYPTVTIQQQKQKTGNFNDNNKYSSEPNESVIMGELEAKYANNLNGFNGEHKNYTTVITNCMPTNANVHFQSPYAMTNIEKATNTTTTSAAVLGPGPISEERYPLNHLNLSPLKSANVCLLIFN